MVDEPAHLATALLLLIALIAVHESPPASGFVLGALVASVVIDLDHLPGYLGWDGLIGDLPRPFTHSLFTVGCLVGAGVVLHAEHRAYALGAAFGVAAHLFRDSATGPGLPLFWPLSAGTVQVAYVVFVIGLATAVAVVLARQSRKTR